MITLISELTKRVPRITHQIFRTSQEINRLLSRDDSRSQLLASIINATRKRQFSPDEKLWLDKINLLRNELNSTSTLVTIVDYGAGAPDIERSQEEMYQGKTVILPVSEISRKASLRHIWPLLLFKIIRGFRPNTCLELGTCLGISTSYQAAALALNGKGRIITIEGADQLAKLANNNFRKLNLANVISVTGRFQDTLSVILQKHSPVDHAFIDGHHDMQATLSYFHQITPHLANESVLLFDDIHWSRGMKNAWDIIRSDSRVKISVDLFAMGICVMSNSLNTKDHYTIALG